MNGSTAGRARATLYRLLAEFLAEPTEDLFRRLARGEAQAELHQVLTALDLPQRPQMQVMAEVPDTPHALWQAHWDAFSRPVGPRVVPVESTYRRWSDEPGGNAPIAGSKGYLMSDHALHVQELYRLCGLQLPAGYEAMPDHLTLELEFMALLCEKGSPADQLRFLQDHLDWLDGLAADARAHGIPLFYRAIIDLAAAVVRRDADRLAAEG